MSQREHTPLTPEERELAQRLSRLDAHAAPSADLDARILAAARAGVEPAAAAPTRGSRRTRRHWPMGLGVAASLVVAVGIAWQLRPLPDTQVMPAPTESGTLSYEAETEAAPAAVELLRTTPSAPSADEAAVAAPPLASAPEPEAPQAQDERHRQQAAEAAAGDAARKQASAREAEEQAVAAQRADVPALVSAPSKQPVAERSIAEPLPLPPPAPPASPPPVSPAQVAAEPAFVPAPPAAAVPATGSKATGQERRALAVPTPAPAPASTGAASGRVLSTDAAGARIDRSVMRDSRVEPPVVEHDMFADQPLDDQPPASADSPEVREYWLQRIRELRDDGELEAARDSLREFVRRHPQAEVPVDLRALLAGG